MRRLYSRTTSVVSTRLLSSLRGRCSVRALEKAQDAIKKGRPPPSKDASEVAEYFRIPISIDDGVEKSVAKFYAKAQKQAAMEEDRAATRDQRREMRKDGDLSLFLLGYDAAKHSFTLYSVEKEQVLCSVSPRTDVWELADEVLAATEGHPQFLLIPLAETAAERAALEGPAKDLLARLRSSGLQPIMHVDAKELCATLCRDAPSLRAMASEWMPGGLPEALTPEWYRAHWIYMRTLACKAVVGDPLHTLNTFVLPRFDVYVVHLVRAGSRSMNVSLYDPVRRRRFSAKGMLSDVLGCLLDTQSSRIIFIPTNRTDRASLFRCRTALLKAGKKCVVVFASEMQESLRSLYQSDPSRYWVLLRDATKMLDADLLQTVYVAAGNTLRAYQQKMLQEGKARDYSVLVGPKKEEDAPEEEDVVTPTEVEHWARYFRHPKRLAAEKQELARYSRYLVVAYTATDAAAYGQPRNPVAPENYVLAAGFADYQGHKVEPWTRYSARDDFRLPALDDYDVLVASDAKHLLLLTWKDKELQKFLARGGRVWCTTLAEYLLEAQRCNTGHNSPGEIALRHGHVLPPSGVIGTAADALPLAFHRRYVECGMAATRAIFEAQRKTALQQCQVLSLAHRMDALLAMASMEWSGIFIDAEEADRQGRSLKNAAASLDRTLAAYVPAEVPVDMKVYFDWNSMPHLQAYFFGGVVSLGHSARARDSELWTANLVHLCHRYGNLHQLTGEVHLQRYAVQCQLAGAGGSSKVPQRVAHYIEQQGTQKVRSYRVIIFDVETTGLNPSSDAIIELAMYDPVEDTTFTTLVNPQRPITPRTIEIHKITNEAVKAAPTMEAVAPAILEYLRLDAKSRNRNEVLLLVGHNVFGVDEPMLRRTFEQHAPDSDFDGILFCDSLVLLTALKTRLRGEKSAKKVDTHLLETLTSSLRLSNLIEALGIHAGGQMHRADTDTKALWYVLVNAFGLAGMPATQQRDGLLKEAATSLVTYPATGCFVPTTRKKASVKLHLPGVAKKFVKNTKVLAQLMNKPFNESSLQSLHVQGVKAAGLVLQRQRLDRHTSRFLQPSGDGRLAVLHPDGAVHQHIDMTATTTSRTVSAYPSCQNIPKDDKSSVRRLFVSRFGAKGRCVEIDYSQLEIVILAILCRDEKLSADLNRGVDFHIKRAAFFSGLSYDEIYKGYTREVPKYVKLRKKAKQFSFQRLYGAGVPLLHKTTGIPVEDLHRSIQMEHQEYPGIRHFHHVIRSVALRPNNPGLPTSFITEMPTGLRMSYRTRDVVLNLPPLKNYPIQGYGAEVAQMMVGRVFRHFLSKNFYKKKAAITNFVHDSVWLDCHVDVLQECVRDTCRILESVHEYIPKVFPGVEVAVPLKVSAACGMDMCSMQSVHSGDFSFIKTQKKTSLGAVSNFLEPLVNENTTAEEIAEYVEAGEEDGAATTENTEDANEEEE